MRPWKDIARELANATDAKLISELSEELNAAIAEQGAVTLPVLAEGEVKSMSDVRDVYGPGLCEAEVCQRDDRLFSSHSDYVRLGNKKFHRECAPTKEEHATGNRTP